MTIGFIGCGKMGGAMIKSIAKSGKIENILVSASSVENAVKFCKETAGKTAGEGYPSGLGCNRGYMYSDRTTLFPATNEDVARDCSVVFLAMKPDRLSCVFFDIARTVQQRYGSTGEKTIFVSMLAGTKISSLQKQISSDIAKFARIMPNLPALICESMTTLCYDATIKKEQVDFLTDLLCCCGKVDVIEEELMDAATSIAGSGPAYAFMFIDALADAAVRFGIPKKKAFIYAAQMLKGSADMVLSGKSSPSDLKDCVCSPKGTTIEAVAKLEEKGFRSCIIEAITACYKKSVSMGKQ